MIMGHWSEDLYSGDSESDVIHNIHGILKTSKHIKDKEDDSYIELNSYKPLHESSDIINALKEKEENILNLCRHKNKTWGDNIHSAIYASIIMRAGLPLNNITKKETNDFINHELRYDILERWINFNKRAFFIEQFKECLNNYNEDGGEPKLISSKYIPEKEIIEKSITMGKDKTSFKI